MWLEDRQQIKEAHVRNERTICNVQKQNVCVCAAVHQKSDLANAKKGKTLRIT